MNDERFNALLDELIGGLPVTLIVEGKPKSGLMPPRQLTLKPETRRE